MTTRLCVKGLGKNTTEADLRRIFLSKGEVTDVRLIKTAEGKSRQFAFVGFRSEAQAADAQKYFHNTFLDSARLTVEVATKVGDGALQSSSRSKHTLKKLGKLDKPPQKSGDEKSNGEKEKSGAKKKGGELIVGSSKADKTKQDFLEVMKKRSDAKFWANDEGLPTDQEVVAGSNPKGVMRGRDGGSDDQDEEDDDEDDDDDDDEVNDFGNLAGKSSGGSKEKSSKTSSLSDMDYLRSKVKSKTKTTADDDEEGEDEDDNEDEEDEEEEKKTSAAEIEEDEPEAEEEDGEFTRLFLRNLPFSCSEAELTELFGTFGPLTEVHIPIDSERGSKGFGYVQFMIPEHAQTARSELDGSSFQGRVLHVLPAKKLHIATVGEGQASASREGASKSRLSSFQLKKEEERRAMANKKEGWNSAFVRSDAVVDALADKYGVDRADILNTAESGGELAVRLAVGEAHVIQENREYFASHGVDITALESTSSGSKASSRSGTTLLVKNLPFDMVAEELEAMFANFGAVAAFLVPRSKTVLLVDFLEPSSARAAFKGLAYRRYKHTPLYIEWAPLGVVLDRTKAAAAKKDDKKSKSKSEGEGGASKGKKDKEEEEDDGSEFATLFVKNLAFSTTEEGLRAHVAALHSRSGSGSSKGQGCGLRAVSIPTKKAASGDHVLSMGFGFCEFASSAQAQAALQLLNKSALDGHSLEVKPSEKRLTAPKGPKGKGGAASGSGNSTKIVVRNVAFQATQSELHALFATFGTVKRVRIPKKMGGVHRGFAFVDFATSQEATAAMTGLANTHLYGRHLVIERAKEEEDDDLNVLRKRANVDTKAISSQKRAKRVDEDEIAMAGTGNLKDHM